MQTTAECHALSGTQAAAKTENQGIPAEHHQKVFQRFYKVDSFILNVKN